MRDGYLDQNTVVASHHDYYERDSYKRALDLTILIVFHVVLSPLWLVLWSLIPLAIWLEDRGPVFYLQQRIGKNWRTFTLIKFRTMTKDAEQATGAVWASENDPRITRVGKVLRRLHLDELPQVINILKGEMSFVGPRPERPELTACFLEEMPNFALRLRVLPGITGLAQLKGSYHSSPRNKLRYDNLYAEKLSPGLDLKLLVLSPIAVLIREMRARSPKKRKTLYNAEECA